MLQLLYQMETFPHWLENQLRNRDWRPADLSRISGISNATISRILNSTRQAGPDACKAIARALQVSQEEVFRRRGFLDPLPPGELDTHLTPEERNLVILYRRLNPDRRQAADNMMGGLVQGMTGHYTFIPATDDHKLTIECYREILGLEDEQQFHEAVIKLLGNTNAEQQRAILEYLIQRRRKRAMQEARTIDAEVGGRAT